MRQIKAKDTSPNALGSKPARMDIVRDDKDRLQSVILNNMEYNVKDYTVTVPLKEAMYLRVSDVPEGLKFAFEIDDTEFCQVASIEKSFGGDVDVHLRVRYNSTGGDYSNCFARVTAMHAVIVASSNAAVDVHPDRVAKQVVCDIGLPLQGTSVAQLVEQAEEWYVKRMREYIRQKRMVVDGQVEDRT